MRRIPFFRLPGLIAGMLVVGMLAACVPLPAGAPTAPGEVAPAASATSETFESEGEMPVQGLEGVLWRLTAYLDGQGNMADALAGVEVTMQLDGGDLVGRAGCNHYFGAYSVRDEELTVRVGGSTMMACAEPTMAQEQAYLALLDRAASYALAGDVLEIADGEGERILVFAAVRPTALIGASWQVTAYDNGVGGMASALAGSEITLVFDPEGYAAGSTGCNSYRAGCEPEESGAPGAGSIAFGPAATTRKLCAEPAGIMDQERAYLAALARSTGYAIAGDRLTLTDAEGASTVEARAAVE